MITLPTKDNFIEVNPLPEDGINKLLQIIHSDEPIMIAGVGWMHEKTVMDCCGITVHLFRRGTEFLEQIAYEGTYVRNNNDDTMVVTANTLAIMLGLDKGDSHIGTIDAQSETLSWGSWQRKTLDVPNDLEIIIDIEPRLMSIQTIPHSPKGEDFASNATEIERLNLINEYLAHVISEIQCIICEGMEQ